MFRLLHFSQFTCGRPSINASQTDLVVTEKELTLQAGSKLMPWLLKLWPGLFFLLTAIWLTWPMSAKLLTAIPIGLEGEATVPLFNLWTIWWNIDRLGHGFAEYWHAPIFSPARLTFALSEPQPTTMLLAPVYVVTDSMILCYNLAVLILLAMCGHASWSLLRLVHVSSPVALLGGLLIQRLPFSFWQMGVLQLLALAGPIWTIYWILKCCREPGWSTSLGLGLSFGLTYWSCNYFGLLLSLSIGISGLLLISAGWFLLPEWRRWKVWASLFAAAILAACLIGPMARVQQEAAREEKWQAERPLELVQNLSARWSDYTWSLTTRLGDYPTAIEPARQNIWRMGCGAVVTILGTWGLLVGLYRQDRRLLTCTVLTFSVVSLLLSFGPEYEIFGWSPSLWLRDHYPGFSHLRSPFRFGAFVQLGWHLLAIQGAEAFSLDRWRWFRKFVERGPDHEIGWRQLSLRALLTSPAILVLGLAVYEVWPAAQVCHPVPQVHPTPQWLGDLRQKTEPHEVLACLPFANGSDASAYESTTLWMYWQTRHHRPMVNGYSGFFPDAYLELRDAMETFPSEESMRLLTLAGVRYLVIDTSVCPVNDWKEIALFRDQTEICFEDPQAGIVVYRYTPRL